jgi:tetratricopeptide (TPR) repeat protein
MAEAKHSEALTELDFAIRADRYLWESYFHRGGVLALLGDLQGAQKAFLRAAALNPGHGKAHELASMASFELEDYEEAWEQAIRGHQAGADVAMVLAQLPQQSPPPLDVEERMNATRMSVVPDLPADPRTQAVVRRVVRAIQSALSDSPAISLTDDNDLAEYLLLVSSEGWAHETLRDVKVKLSLAARDGEGVGSRRMTLGTLDDQDHVRAQIERYVSVIEAWLREN